MLVKVNMDSVHGYSPSLPGLIKWSNAGGCKLLGTVNVQAFATSSRVAFKLYTGGVNVRYKGKKLQHLPFHLFPNIKLFEAHHHDFNWKIQFYMSYVGRRDINYPAFSKFEEAVVLLCLNTVYEFGEKIVRNWNLIQVYDVDQLQAFVKRLKTMRHFTQYSKGCGFQTFDMDQSDMLLFWHCFEIVFHLSSNQDVFVNEFGVSGEAERKMNDPIMLGRTCTQSEMDRIIDVRMLFETAKAMRKYCQFTMMMIGFKPTYLQEMKKKDPGIEDHALFRYIGCETENEIFEDYIRKGDLDDKLRTSLTNVCGSFEKIVDCSQYRECHICSSFDVGIDFQPETDGCIIAMSKPDFDQSTQNTNLNMARFKENLENVLMQSDINSIIDSLSEERRSVVREVYDEDLGEVIFEETMEELLAPSLARLTQTTSRLSFSEYSVGDCMRYCMRHSGHPKAVWSRLDRVAEPEGSDFEPEQEEGVVNDLKVCFSREDSQEKYLGCQTYHPAMRYWMNSQKYKDMKVLRSLFPDVFSLLSENHRPNSEELEKLKEKVRKGFVVLLSMQEKMMMKMKSDKNVALRVEFFMSDSYYRRKHTAEDVSTIEDFEFLKMRWSGMLHVCFSGIEELLDGDEIEDMSKPYFRDESAKMQWNSDIMKSVFDEKLNEVEHYREFSVGEKVGLCVLLEKMYIDLGLMLGRESRFWENVKRMTPVSKQMSIPCSELEIASERCRREHGLPFGVSPRLTQDLWKSTEEGLHPYREFFGLLFLNGNLMRVEFPNERYRTREEESNERNCTQRELLNYFEKRSANRMEVGSVCRNFRCGRITVLVWEHIRVLFYVLDCFSCWKEENKNISEGNLEEEDGVWQMFEDCESLSDFVEAMMDGYRSIPLRTPGVFEDPKISYPWVFSNTLLIGLLRNCLRLIVVNYTFEMYYLKVLKNPVFNRIRNAIDQGFTWEKFPVNKEMLDDMGIFPSPTCRTDFFSLESNGRDQSGFGANGLGNATTIFHYMFGDLQLDDQSGDFVNRKTGFERSGFIRNLGKLFGEFRKLRRVLTENDHDMGEFALSECHLREEFVVEYARECSGLYCPDASLLVSTVYFYPLYHYNRSKKLVRPPVEINWELLLTSIGEEDYRTREERAAAQLTARVSRVQLKTAYEKLREKMGCDFFRTAWKGVSDMKKLILMKAIWNHLLPVQCKHKRFHFNKRLVLDFFHTNLVDGIRMYDFYLDEKTALEAVRNSIQKSSCGLFGIITNVEKSIMNFEEDFKTGKERLLIRFMIDLFGKADFSSKIDRLREEFYDPTIGMNRKEWREYLSDANLEEDTTSVDMFKVKEEEQTERLDEYLDAVNMNFNQALEYVKESFVMTKKYVKTAAELFRETQQIYLDLEDWKDQNAPNAQYLKAREDERLTELSEKYGIKRNVQKGIPASYYK